MAKPNEGEDQREPRLSQEQYDMLKRCSDKKDMTEWNEWREKHAEKDVFLAGANFARFHMHGANFGRGVVEINGIEIAYTGEVHMDKADFRSARVQATRFWRASMREVVFWSANARGADFSMANLEGAKLDIAHFERCRFTDASLSRASLSGSWLDGANFTQADLTESTARASTVSGESIFWECRVDRETDFQGTSLANCRIDRATRQLLEYNIRRKNWKQWYKGQRFLHWPVQLFWLASDYGLSTGRVLVSFGVLAFAFALVYWLWPGCVMVYGKVGDIRGFVHALYFSVVTMTTLGFGDIAANPDSTCGQLLLMFQVILGYVLLGALVTRFAVLFTAGGPAGQFADEKGIIDRVRGFVTRRFGRRAAK